jgi:anti-sigma factor RsiW
MACPSESELLKMVAGELAEPRRAEVAEHVEGCTTCAQQLQDLRDVWGAMDAWAVDTAGHEIDRAVLAAAGSETIAFPARHWHTPWQWPVPLRAAASFLLAAGIGWAAGMMAPNRARPDQADIVASAEPVTPGQIAADLSLDALNGGTMPGLGALLLDEQQTVFEEDQG